MRSPEARRAGRGRQERQASLLLEPVPFSPVRQRLSVRCDVRRRRHAPPALLGCGLTGSPASAIVSLSSVPVRSLPHCRRLGAGRQRHPHPPLQPLLQLRLPVPAGTRPPPPPGRRSCFPSAASVDHPLFGLRLCRCRLRTVDRTPLRDTSRAAHKRASRGGPE